MKTRVCLIISDVDKVLAFEWITAGFNKDIFDLNLVLINERPSHLAKFAEYSKIPATEILYSTKFSLLIVWLSVMWRILIGQFDIVHTHLLKANIIGLSLAWLLRVKKRVSTRHHALSHYNDYPTGLKWDKLCNFLATDIIAVSENVRRILIEKDRVPHHKVRLIHHGFDLEFFQNVTEQRKQDIQKKYGITAEDYPVIGVIARHVEWKGLQYIIPAFKKFLRQYPNAILIMSNSHGEYTAQIQKLLAKIDSSRFKQIKFEYDLAALYQIMDVYVHCPIDESVEAFGQTYVESLASGIPSIFTKSGVANEFIVDGKNCLIIEHCDDNAHKIDEMVKVCSKVG